MRRLRSPKLFLKALNVCFATHKTPIEIVLDHSQQDILEETTKKRDTAYHSNQLSLPSSLEEFQLMLCSVFNL